jgi:hypothetical protein
MLVRMQTRITSQVLFAPIGLENGPHVSTPPSPAPTHTSTFASASNFAAAPAPILNAHNAFPRENTFTTTATVKAGMSVI